MNTNQMSSGKVLILSETELNRIKGNVYRASCKKAELVAQQAEREQMRECSRNMSKNWTNTIVGQRLKKQEIRKQKEQKEEEERIQLDLEEAQYQAQKRKEAIEKAKTLQYYQTDRIKKLHGALLLSEVLRERDAQVKFKNKIRQIQKTKEAEFVEFIKEDYKKYLEEHKKTEQEKINKRQQLDEELKKQIQERKENEQRYIEVLQKEREQVQQQDEQFKQEQIKKKEQDKEAKHVLKQDLLKMLNNKEIYLQRREKSKEDEARRAHIFAGAKEKMSKMRKEKEQEEYRKKLEQKEKMIDLLVSHLGKKFQNEEDFYEKGKAEIEKQQQELERRKAEEKKKITEEILKSHQQQAQEKKQKFEEEKLIELEDMYQQEEAMKLFCRTQHDQKQRRLNAAHNCGNFQKQQAKEKLEIKKELQNQQLEDDLKLYEQLQKEEATFQNYAQELIKDSEAKNRKMFPLYHAATPGIGGGFGPVYKERGGIRPSYLASDQSGAEMPHSQPLVSPEFSQTQTYERLGFIC